MAALAQRLTDCGGQLLLHPLWVGGPWPPTAARQGLAPMGRVRRAGARHLAGGIPCEAALVAAADKGATAELVGAVQIAAAVPRACLTVLACSGVNMVCV